MFQHQQLLSLWVCLLLLAALCPECADGKRGGFFKGRGKEKSDKPPTSGGHGLPKQGLKLAGAAAAAGILGGTGTGYGLGFLGKPKRRGSGGGGGHAAHSQHHYQQHENHGHGNRSQWGALVNKAGAATPAPGVFLAVGQVVSLFIAAWI